MIGKKLSSFTEGLRSSDIGKGLSQAARGARRRGKAWVLRRRRARVSRRKTTNRKSTYVLLLSFIVLLGSFTWAMSYLKADVGKNELSIAQLSGLAGERRLISAQFLDEDAVVVGEYAAKSLPDPETDDESGESTTDPDETAGAGSSEASQNEAGRDKKADGKKKAGRSGSAGNAKDAKSPKTEGKNKDGGGNEAGPAVPVAPVSGSGQYWVAYPSTGSMTPYLAVMAAEAGADITVDLQTSKKVVRVVSTFLLPLMILVNLFALLFASSKGGSSGIGDIIMFGSMSKGRRKGKKGPSPVTFAQVAGADEAVAELKEVVDYLKDPERYEDVGATPPKGVLLFGPPGCGKTLLAKAVAGEAGVPFFSVAGAEFVESLVGVGAARVRDLFQRVRAVAPAIVFIDELDAAGRKRGQGGGGGGSDEREQTLNQMLVEMDGFDVSSGIVVIGATNRPDILDPALLRPGRFDRHVTIDHPDIVGRQLILELHARNKPVSPTVDFTYLARRTPGFSGADLANVLNEAALLMVREGKEEIEITEFEEAIQRVLSGPKRKGRVLSPEERERAAYHESGHAIVAAGAGRLEDVHRISILARGRGLGMTGIQRESDAALLTKDQLVAELVTAFGGLASEELVFGVPSTGSEKDIEEATDLAIDMVGRYGMGSRRRRLLSKEGEVFLGDQLGLGQISSQVHHEMENDIDRLLEEAEREATRLLEEHRSVLDTLAQRLLDEETLEGPDLEEVLALVRPEVSLFGGVLATDDMDGGGNGLVTASEEV